MLQKAMENFHLQTAKEVFQSTEELTVSLRIREISLLILHMIVRNTFRNDQTFP